ACVSFHAAATAGNPTTRAAPCNRAMQLRRQYPVDLLPALGEQAADVGLDARPRAGPARQVAADGPGIEAERLGERRLPPLAKQRPAGPDEVFAGHSLTPPSPAPRRWRAGRL